jgi:hypothetical protein
VGETRTVLVKWGINLDSLLSPITGPDAIYMSTSLGSLDRYRTTPLVATGTSNFQYVAEKDGTEIIHASAMIGEDTDASASVTFEVKQCEYRYKLYAQGNLETDFDVSMRFIISSEGVLKATEPSIPLVYEGFGKEIRWATTITAFSSENCKLLTWEPGIGSGFVDVKARSEANNPAMTVQFSPPSSFQVTHDIRFVCENGSSGHYENLSIETDNDPWIETVFPNGPGVQEIKLDVFERAMNALVEGKVVFTYSAKLTLEKIVPQ